MQIAQGAKFERPIPGMYLATLVDVVDLPQVQTQYGTKDKLRFHWVLAYLNGQLYLGKDGKPVEATLQLNANMGSKAELPKRLMQILGQAPPVITSTEQLEQLVLGRSSVLVISTAPNPKDPNDPYANVEGIGPISPGMPAPPPVPQGYVRHKNRAKTVVGPNGQPVQTYATPAAAATAPAAAPAAYPSGQPVPSSVPPAPPGFVFDPKTGGYVPAPTSAPQPAAGAPVNLSAGQPAKPF